MTRFRRRTNATPAALTAFGLGTAALTAAAHGQIRFDSPRSYFGPFQHVAVADLNGNGHLDAAVGTNDGVRIFLNSGDGTLVHEATLLEGFNVRVLEAGDVDGDGHVDLVMLEWFPDGERRLHYFYNSGDGREGELHALEMRARATSKIALADLTGNGQLDVIHDAFANRASIWMAAHQGRGNYVEQQVYRSNHSGFRIRDVVVGDLSGDGDVDIAFLENHASDCHNVRDAQVVVLLNAGRSRPHAWAYSPGVRGNYLPTNLRVGDIDGDGHLDLVLVAHEYHDACHGEAYLPADVSILVNNGAGGFRRGPLVHVGGGAVGGLLLCDLDSDGRLDVVTATRDDWRGTTIMHVVRNLGGLTFEAPIDIPLGQSWPHVTGDFNGDGRPDLLTLAWQSHMLQFLNATVIDNPLLHVGPLLRGQAAEFVVTDAEPGETVDFLYSLTGQGNSRGIGVLGGITLDLLDPIVHFGSATADAQGEAMLTVIVPSNAPLRPVTFQSVIRRGPGGRESVKAPFQVGLIEE